MLYLFQQLMLLQAIIGLKKSELMHLKILTYDVQINLLYFFFFFYSYIAEKRVPKIEFKCTSSPSTTITLHCENESRIKITRAIYGGNFDEAWERECSYRDGDSSTPVPNGMALVMET